MPSNLNKISLPERCESRKAWRVMSNNKNNQDDEGSSRVIDSFIRRAVDEGSLDPDELDGRPNNVFWDRTTIRAALGGLAVLILVNLFFFYNMRIEQVDNTADWVPERRGFLVEYREGVGKEQASESSSSPTLSTEVRPPPGQTLSEPSQADEQEVPATGQMPSGESQSATELPASAESGSPETTSAPDQTSIDPDIDSSVAPDSSDTPVSPTDQIRELVSLWAQTWSFQMVDDYLDLYSRDFVSQGGAPYEPWAELRRERIEDPEWIHVSVDELKIFVNEDSAVAEFVQVYASSDFGADSRKTLLFQPEGNGWKIIRETVHPAP